MNSANASLGSASCESGSVGLGFAIPVDEAKRIADELIATGTGSHGFLGARIADDQLIDNADALVTTMHAEAPGATIAVNYLDPSGLRALQRSCSERIRVSGENR